MSNSGSLSGDLWPLHLKSQPDELLSSWMTRLARAYGIDPTLFWKRVTGDAKLLLEEIDLMVTEEIASLLARRPATACGQVMNASLLTYRGTLFRIGLKHAIRYCPTCLTEDSVPYFRRSWCFEFITICDRHSLRMLDTCSSCHEPIRFYRVPLDADSLAVCYVC